MSPTNEALLHLWAHLCYGLRERMTLPGEFYRQDTGWNCPPWPGEETVVQLDKLDRPHLVSGISFGLNRSNRTKVGWTSFLYQTPRTHVSSKKDGFDDGSDL